MPEYNRHFHRTFVSRDTYTGVCQITMEKIWAKVKTWFYQGLRSKISKTPKLANPYFLIILPSYTKVFSVSLLYQT